MSESETHAGGNVSNIECAYKLGDFVIAKLPFTIEFDRAGEKSSLAIARIPVRCQIVGLNYNSALGGGVFVVVKPLVDDPRNKGVEFLDFTRDRSVKDLRYTVQIYAVQPAKGDA